MPHKKTTRILFITGATHTGKTVLADRLLRRHGVPVLSLDLLKMGLIRSAQTSLTPLDDDALTSYMWPIVREMVRTALENERSLIVEGSYIPWDWAKDFSPEEKHRIDAIALVMTPEYLVTHFHDVVRYANAAEKRLDDSNLTLEALLEENRTVEKNAQDHGFDVVRIDRAYRPDYRWIVV